MAGPPHPVDYTSVGPPMATSATDSTVAISIAVQSKHAAATANNDASPSSLKLPKEDVGSDASSSSSSWRKDIFLLVATSLTFLLVLFALHAHTRPHPASLRPHITASPPYHHSNMPRVLLRDDIDSIRSDTEPMRRHLLSTVTLPPKPSPATIKPTVAKKSPSNPPAGYYDPRTPAQRAALMNQHAPFRSAAEKQRRYAQWQTEFQVLLDKHRDPRAAMLEWIGPAVKPLAINAAPLHTTNRTVVVLEGRQDEPFIFLLKHAFHLLGPGWGLVVFHTRDNEKWWIEQLDIRPGGGGEHVEMQRVDPIAKAQANSLPTSPVFYERIGVEIILLMQPDTMMLRSEYWPSAERGQGPSLNAMIDQYVYLGAPWSWCKEPWCLTGGNGGLSMRKSSVMMDMIRELRCTDWVCKWEEQFEAASHQQVVKMKHVEDTFFAHQLHDHRYKYTQGITQLAGPATQAWFALESKDFAEVTQPWFVHKVWVYMSHLRYGPIMAQTKQYYPELWMTAEELAAYRQEIA